MPELRFELDATLPRDFENHWQRLRILLEEPPLFAIQFVFSSNYELHSALLRRLQQTAYSLAVDCLELPKTNISELGDIGTSTAPSTAHQLAEAITRHCLARIFPPAPPHTRLLLLDLHQALPQALAALLGEPVGEGRSAILRQALADSRALLLSRLNERRAQLSAFGPLLILLPEDWTKPAAEYAPDLWTQRLSSLYLPPPTPCAEGTPSTEPAQRATTPEEAPRTAERNILARWQEALRSGQTQRLPISDGWIAAETSAKLGNGQEAEDIAALTLRLAYERGSLRDQMVSQNILGDMRLRRGRIEQTREAYTVALSIAQELVSKEPDNTEWQRDLSVSYIKVADILRRSDPAAALDNYQASLKIAQDLARREPDNTEWQRDLSVCYNNVADMLCRSDPAAALDNYQASLKIAQDLAQREPDNIELQADQIVSHVNIAALHPTVPTAEARAHLQAALQLARQLEHAQLLTHDQAGWPDEIQRQLDALPLA